MPPRDENNMIYIHDFANGAEMHLSEVTHITEEDIIDAPAGDAPMPFNVGELTATLDASLNLDALTALVGEAPGTPPSPPWYDEFVDVRVPVMPAEPAVNRNGSAVDRALREITRRIQESMDERIRQNIQESIYQQLERELSGVADVVANSARSAASASSAISDWMDALNDAWASVSEDFELGDEEEYQATDPISFDELMEFGGESK